MDEDSDVDRELDNSLVDLHHGLDSSTEDNRVEENTGCSQDVYVGNGTQPVDLPAQHVNMLEDMVQEMRQGLQAAVQELAKLQIREDGERDKQIQQQQQRQLDDLTENVSALKSQMNSVTKCLETIQRDNGKLMEDYASLTKYIKDTKGDGMTRLSDHSFEWNEKLPENPFEAGNEEEVTYRDDSNKENDDEVTAVACKSLSLTQALGEKCLHLNLSMSSDEGDDPEMRRLSHFTPGTDNTHSNNETNRRHSLPASTTPRGDRVTNAGQRRKAVKELTDSECDYCSQLWTLIETYCVSLQNAGFLSHDQLEVLFPSYLEKLYEQHCVIYSNLQDKLVHWSYLTVVSDLLSCITDTHNPYSLLSLYREYSENLPDAVSCLQGTLAHSTELKALLKTIQQSSYQNDDLMTLIKAPAQHLSKYLLQLQQICKYTPSTHPDYLLLRTSLSRLRLFVEQMNIGINNAMQAASREFRPGSSNDSCQMLSARDSGNLSNEDDLLSARTLFKSEQCLLSDEMQGDPYHLSVVGNQATNGSYGRHSRGIPGHKSSNLNTLSHPDLSRLNNSPVLNSAPFSLPPTGLGHGWRNGVEGRQTTKNKMKRAPIHPAPFPHQDPNHHLSTSRPSSAIDFTNGYNNVYPVHHYPGANYPRPRSAMGPLDSHHRPAIISRKHMRRSQPPLSNSGYWADIDSQHSKHSQQRMSFSPHELLPSRPSPLLLYNSQEDDEEDDTRASDSFSCQTSSSHHQSSGRGSNNGHDIDLEFQPLASEPSPFRPNGNKQISEDDVAVRLAQELLSEDDEDRQEVDNAEINNGIPGNKIHQTAENRSYRQQRVSESKTKTNESERKVIISKQPSSRSTFDNVRDQSSNKLSNSNESEGFENLTNHDHDITPTKDAKHSSPQQDSREETHIRESRVFKQNGNQRDNGHIHLDDNEEEDKRLKNQHFLLSLTHSPRSKKSPEASSNIESSHGNSSRSAQSRSPVPPSSDKKSDKPLPDDKVLNSQKSQPKVYRRSAPSLISEVPNGSQSRDNETRVSSPSQPTNGSFTTYPDNSVTSGAPSRHYIRTSSPSTMPTEVSSERKSSNSRRTTDLDSKNLMTRSLDLSEVLKTDDGRESNDRRKKLKNGGTDSLPRASDDPVNARKKMHLKSSLKNLFSKKRGKVILADVEREVILEMASAVVSASTSPSSMRSSHCSPVTNSPQKENLKCRSSTFSCNKELMDSAAPKEGKQQNDENHKVQRIPEAFEIRCKKDKGSSTSSPLKVWRHTSFIQPSENLPKSFHRLSLGSVGLPQSPCVYQDKLLKERMNIHGNPDLEQKPLIHPKFLVSAKPKENEDEFLSNVNAMNHSVHSSNASNISNAVCSNLETHLVLLKEKQSQDDKVEKIKNDNFHKNIKYEEPEKKQLKAKMKAYAHMKKHILNYESQEAAIKVKDEGAKRNPDKSNAKPIKHKVECPKCQNKSPDGWKYLEQTPGKSFHIQAYKAYKNKNRESITVDKQETDALYNKDQNVQHQNKVKPDTISSQSSMRLLKPCEEAIAFYETSKNPKMTSSYPIAAQERKIKKNYLMKESGHLLHSNHTSGDGKKCRPKEKSLRENILSLSSGVFYDVDCPKPQSNPIAVGSNTSTNDLSHPTGTTMTYNAISPSKPICFNVPAPVSTNSNVASSSNNLNKGHNIESGSCVNNIIKMCKEESIECEKSQPPLNGSKGKTMIGKPNAIIAATTTSSDFKECAVADTSKHVTSDGQDFPKYCQSITSDLNKIERDVDVYCLKEERDYFDYTYRLCYVDCTKFEGDLSSCANCSAEENGVENKSFPEYFRNGETVNNNIINMNAVSKGRKQDACSISVDKRLEIETKSCSEINKWLSNFNNSSSPPNKDSGLFTKQPKEKVLSANKSTEDKNNMCSPVATRSLPSSTSSQSKQVKCALHPEGIHHPGAPNRNNCRNSTFETFSPSMSQPIFSVLPIEGYRVDSQLPSTLHGGYPSYEGQTTSQIDPHSSKSQDDAIARRALKQRVTSKDVARLSTCSIQSANEIHILKLHNFGDVQYPVESESKAKHTKDSSPHHKMSNPGTIQVRYIPKQPGSSKQNKVQTTAHAQIKRDYIVNGTATSPPTQNVMRCSSSIAQQSGHGAGHIASQSHDLNGISASGVSGPDLLQVSVIQPGTHSKSDSSDQLPSATPKKMSFFSRFAHSPLSIFYKDSKNNGSK